MSISITEHQNVFFFLRKKGTNSAMPQECVHIPIFNTKVEIDKILLYPILDIINIRISTEL
jgi:hypothetical protein